MRASLRALSVVAIVSSATSAAAAPSLWDGGLLPEESWGGPIIRTTMDAAPFLETSDRDIAHSADFAFLWDGGPLPEQRLAVTFARTATEVAPTSREIDETYVPLADEEVLASIAAFIERDLRAFVFLLDHEGNGTSHIGYPVSPGAQPEWAAIDQLPGPGELAGLVVPGRKFLVEDEDDLLDVHTASLTSAEGSSDSEQLDLALEGYEDR